MTKDILAGLIVVVFVGGIITIALRNAPLNELPNILAALLLVVVLFWAAHHLITRFFP